MIHSRRLPVFFHRDQLKHRPLYEWAFGMKTDHPETTNRAELILESIRKDSSSFDLRTPLQISEKVINKVHNSDLVTLYQAAEKLGKNKTFYPNVFPKRDQCRPNPLDLNQAGYYCFDSGTPLTATTRMAAFWSASCAFSAAKAVVNEESRIAYALCRPPGHHASRSLSGGYCYFNNAAIAVEALRKNGGRVAVVDIDFHHGNGTQSIFYRDKDVLFSSIHGDPRKYYPYFSGHANEKGIGLGEGTNLNFPLPGKCDGKEYIRILSSKIIPSIRRFHPHSLVISAGFDTYYKDPIGDFDLRTADYSVVGDVFARLNLPTVIVQEGGYCTPALGQNVTTFLRAFLPFRRSASKVGTRG